MDNEDDEDVFDSGTAILKLAIAILEDTDAFDDLVAKLVQKLSLPDGVMTMDALSEIAYSVHHYATDCMSPFIHPDPSHRERFARRLAEAFVKHRESDWQATMETVWEHELSSEENVQ